jgi:threonine/homoserine/homoserine lactone efflux protein
MESFGLGLGLGVVTGMPLGVINVAIVDAALAGRRRFATGLGLGGALADTIHAGLAFVGVGRLVTARPELVRGFAIGAAALILIYVAFAWRASRQVAATPDDDPVDRSSLPRGAIAGYVLTLPNPGALAAWVAVAAALWPDATLAEALTLAAGVGIGSAVWFAALARWVSRARSPRIARLSKIALGVLVAIAAIGLVRAL